MSKRIPIEEIRNDQMKTKSSKPKRIYLDVCALCRPFDEQRQARIRLETNAVLLICEHIKSESLRMIVSPAHYLEIKAIAQRQEARQILEFLRHYGSLPHYDMLKGKIRAEILHQNRLGPGDAAHIAFAEQEADVFITCDDALMRKCRTRAIQIPVIGPLEFCAQENLR